MSQTFLVILGMAVVTYSTRAALLLGGSKIALPPRVVSALGFLPVALLSALIAPSTLAQTWPSKLVRVVTGSVAGGGADVTGRPIAQRMSEMLKQQVIIDNRPGAAGLLANDLVAKSAPDGYTLLLTPGSFLIITSYLNARPPYNPQTVLMPIVQADVYNFVVVVHPSVPAKNAKELLAVAKARPGALTFVSSGVGFSRSIQRKRFVSLSSVGIRNISMSRLCRRPCVVKAKERIMRGLHDSGGGSVRGVGSFLGDGERGRGGWSVVAAGDCRRRGNGLDRGADIAASETEVAI